MAQNRAVDGFSRPQFQQAIVSVGMRRCGFGGRLLMCVQILFLYRGRIWFAGGHLLGQDFSQACEP
ncbi:MAG TPA: hypothetical protein VFM39_06505, partial [bacterium]|nr:hypothetical protein [bacterium]